MFCTHISHRPNGYFLDNLNTFKGPLTNFNNEHQKINMNTNKLTNFSKLALNLFLMGYTKIIMLQKSSQ